MISIEEDGQITIEQVAEAPLHPEWWARLSSTFLSHLSSGHLIDLWLLCSDGEAVPAHQLLLAHASPSLAVVLAEARDPGEAATLSLPDWDSAAVGLFVSSLYQGRLPPGAPERAVVASLAKDLGLQLGGVAGVTGAEEVAEEEVMEEGAEEAKAEERKEREETKDTKEAVKMEGGGGAGASEGLGSQQVQVVQTDSGEILLVTCDSSAGGAGAWPGGGAGAWSGGEGGAGWAGGEAQPAAYDDELERSKAVKIAQIKEQQGKQCPACFATAIQHRVTTPASPGTAAASPGQKFAYKCCTADCSAESLKTARAFNQHMSRHGEAAYEPASRVCPLCFRPRIEHKNRSVILLNYFVVELCRRSIPEEEKGNHRGNLYKCCHCAASKLSAKKFFTHLENHVTKKHMCTACGKGYSYKHLLNEHTWKEHGEGQHIRFPCSWEGCDYTAKYKQTLHTHVMERHHGVKRKHRQEVTVTSSLPPSPPPPLTLPPGRVQAGGVPHLQQEAEEVVLPPVPQEDLLQRQRDLPGDLAPGAAPH